MWHDGKTTGVNRIAGIDTFCCIRGGAQFVLVIFSPIFFHGTSPRLVFIIASI
jgi:hypothetical protein